MVHINDNNNMDHSACIDVYTDVYTGVTDIIMNIALTIMRDGLNWYYEY